MRAWCTLFLVVSFAVHAAVALDKATDEEFNGPYPSWRNLKTVYGAVGDGVADDTAAWQAALNDLKQVQTNNWSVLYVPAGIYKITATLTTQRNAHNDYLGAQIIGEDPATTELRWYGPNGSAMLRWDAWYDKVSRLHFNGRSIAGTGLQRAGGFATYGELSDLDFSDIPGSGIDLGAGEAQGIAEQAVLRCRFRRCGKGLLTWNYNTLDIYVWHCFFEDCGTSLYNATGAFHAYKNRFLRSTVADMKIGDSTSSVVGNVSLGSKAFFTNAGEYTHVQDNVVYSSADTAITSSAGMVLLDNIFVGGGQPSLRLTNNGVLMAGNIFATSAAWPFRPLEQPYNHGLNAYATNGHPIEHAIDGNVATYATLGMWRFDAGCLWDAPIGTAPVITQYAIATTNDMTGFAPKEFTFAGSNDWGVTWTELDHQTGQTFATTGQRRVYSVAAPAAYAHYRLRIISTAEGKGPPTGGFVSLAALELLTSTGTNVAITGNGFLHGADEPWGSLQVVDHQQVAPGTYPVPSSLEPWAFVAKVTRPIIDVPAFTGTAIQTAINQAVAAGTRTVVHLRKGDYTATATLTIPALADIVVIGDGGAEHGSSINGSGSPALHLLGPSRATIRDCSVLGTNNGIEIENADQNNGRVWGNQVSVNGRANNIHHLGQTWLIDGVERSDVTVIAFGMTNFNRGIRSVGGPTLAGGGSTAGQVAFLTGASSFGCSAYEVQNKGRLAVTAVWYEGQYPAAPRPMIDLDATLAGTLTMAGMLVSVEKDTFPLMRTNSFAGDLNVLACSLDQRNVTSLSFAGNGSATHILGAGLHYPLFADPNPNKSISAIWQDTTSPAGKIAHGSSPRNTYPPFTDKVVGRSADLTWLRARLAHMRDLRIDPALNRPAGVTDVKLIRCGVSGGDGLTGIVIRASAETAPATPTNTPTVSNSSSPTPTISGTGTAGLTAHILIDGTIVGSTTIAGNGTWSWTATPALAPGSHTLAYQLSLNGGPLSGTSPSTVIEVASVPDITSQPSNVSVMAGQTASFSVTAQGIPAPTLQWQKNNADISGATSANYTTPTTVLGDSGATYRVIVSNSAGTVTSISATLTVTAATVAPTITAQPTNQSVTAGQTAIFSVTATGNPALTYQWQKNNANISGAMNASYTTPATTSGDSGTTYRVVVSNSAGTVTSTNATLTVTTTMVAPVITAQPTNQSVTVGQTATIAVTATGTPTPTYQWQKNNSDISGATSANYTTPATVQGDSGATYRVIVSNSEGTVTSTAATLTVTAETVGPVITSQPTNQSVTAGQTATFTVTATGTPTPMYQWQKNNVDISGATNASYTTPVTVLGDSGSGYRVVVSNSAGTVNSTTATLTVTAATVAPTITNAELPDGVRGTAYSYTCTANGTPPRTWSLASGALPPGLLLQAGTGTVAGTPTTVGTFSSVIRVENGTVPAATHAVEITITEPAAEAESGVLSDDKANPCGFGMGLLLTAILVGAGLGRHRSRGSHRPNGETLLRFTESRK